ncbi:MAG TPA: molybdenum cofactor biosynthesis protein MoaE [Actinomycetota bacterium]|nr:molybdenum cofactor biosynthesis protein MoaE [Actinomycetota bacterium]
MGGGRGLGAGGPEAVLVRITADALSVDDAVRYVADPGAGGTCVFIGTVRDRSDAGDVTDLTYEAWTELAVARLHELAAEVAERWPVRRIALLHRTGQLRIGETSVVVAVSAPHRAEAFDACRHAIERLKHDVPIWKKEGLVDGDAHWVMGA